MRLVCVICTDIFLINSQISACNCGHIFHEDCLSRWLKVGQQTNCPQCRAKVKEANIIKRLYLTESDSVRSSTQSLCSANFLADGENSEAIKQKYEDLINKIQELKADLKDRDDTLATKSRNLEQKEKRLKELEETNATSKKKLNENQLLVDYLKKELEAYERLKQKYEDREKIIFELESKLREYRNHEMIYKGHAKEFESEMTKYLYEMNNSSHMQRAIRQLVNTNVLLKENLDKQVEDKRQARKKLMQLEKIQVDKDRFIAKKEQEMKEMSEKLKRKQHEYQSKSEECKSLQTCLDISKESIKVIADTPTLKTDNDDSDVQYMSNSARVEKNYYKTKSNEPQEQTNSDSTDTDSVIMTPMNKKRKNPFARIDSSKDNSEDTADNFKTYEKKQAISINSEDDVMEITSFQKNMPSKNQKKTTSLSQLFEISDDEEKCDTINLVKPIKSMIVKQAMSGVSVSGSSINRLVKMNSFALGDTKSSKLNESVEIKPLTSNGFYFQYDGLGGRKKVAKSENLKSSLFSSTKASKMQKFSRSKVT